MSNPELRARALQAAGRMVEKIFEDRKGHGRGQVGYRNFTRQDLTAILGAAYELGAEGKVPKPRTST